MSELNLDPAKLIANTKLPTLVVQGDHDLHVRLEDAQLLGTAQQAAKVVVIPGMKHVLVQALLDMQSNYQTYSNANLPLERAAVQAVVDFLKAQLK